MPYTTEQLTLKGKIALKDIHDILESLTNLDRAVILEFIATNYHPSGEKVVRIYQTKGESNG